jgi:hypothetical protein
MSDVGLPLVLSERSCQRERSSRGPIFRATDPAAAAAAMVSTRALEIARIDIKTK